jgi:hypothetical protein
VHTPARSELVSFRTGESFAYPYSGEMILLGLRISILTTTIAVAALTSPLSMSAQQSLALLEITSPAAGTVISPGQTLTVIVTSPANAIFDHIGLIGTGEIGIALPT